MWLPATCQKYSYLNLRGLLQDETCRKKAPWPPGRQWKQGKEAFHTHPPSDKVPSKEPPSTNKATLSFFLRKQAASLRMEYDNHLVCTIFGMQTQLPFFCIFLSPKLYFRHLFINYSHIQSACVYISQRKYKSRRPQLWVSPNGVQLSTQGYNQRKNWENVEMLKGWGQFEK